MKNNYQSSFRFFYSTKIRFVGYWLLTLVSKKYWRRGSVIYFAASPAAASPIASWN